MTQGGGQYVPPGSRGSNRSKRPKGAADRDPVGAGMRAAEENLSEYERNDRLFDEGRVGDMDGVKFRDPFSSKRWVRPLCAVSIVCAPCLLSICLCLSVCCVYFLSVCCVYCLCAVSLCRMLCPLAVCRVYCLCAVFIVCVPCFFKH